MAAIAQVKKDDLKTGNKKSPEAETSVTVNGKNIWIFYHAPSVNGRKIFGGDKALQPDGSVWRLGADYATVLHTDADLTINDLKVPKGDYTLYADLDGGQWLHGRGVPVPTRVNLRTSGAESHLFPLVRGHSDPRHGRIAGYQPRCSGRPSA